MGKQLEPQTLKEFRQDRGMSQALLAKKLGISGPLIGHYENGRQEPSARIKLEFKKAFGNYNVPIMQLTAEEEKELQKVKRGPTSHEYYKSINGMPMPKAINEPERITQRLPEAVKAEPKLTKPGTETIHVLRGKDESLAFRSYAVALDKLSEIILADPDTYGWTIEEVELR